MAINRVDCLDGLLPVGALILMTVHFSSGISFARFLPTSIGLIDLPVGGMSFDFSVHQCNR